MIINKTPLTLAEVKEYCKDLENQGIHDYLKTFVKTSKADAVKCSAEIRALDNPKIKEENIISIIDFLPQDLEDLNKIFLDVTLTEEESNAIIAIVKKY
ncbi:MAG: hypothetical protein AABX85_01020 [Nanoarchaeota archaeon]